MALPVMKAPMKATKQAKVMKAKRVSKIATGRLAKAMVFRGSKEKTSGGLKADALMRNRRFKQIEDWADAFTAAREALHVKGFVAVNGKTLQGKALYVKMRTLVAASR